jgi:hypothetical protein
MTLLELKPADASIGEKSRALFAIWQALKGERLAPKREEVTLSHTRALTASLWFIDVVDGGEDYCFRLGGEEIVRFLGGRHSGMKLSQVPPNPFFERMKRTLAFCVEQKKPVSLGPIASGYPGKEHWEMEVVLLPLSGDGETVNCVMGTMQLWPRGTMTCAKRA